LSETLRVLVECTFKKAIQPDLSHFLGVIPAKPSHKDVSLPTSSLSIVANSQTRPVAPATQAGAIISQSSSAALSLSE